ncbi:sigma-54-dependent Fis family transcriptional regulator [Gelidibacter salicanalis]|uniref:Sigma-54-dependent Fis family transcriptional regulator n=1 Tax=Gelidibacter salicanalis TaxID=291193 RepID=A0A5C7AIP1_9FLAO|nr:sigma-54 dependent transcriptional regulator [Gelidibacter salicanalis]TXE08580.1 sigma-54-dependent Fis family transcriptional regulator [Gelidibacter salicanalis]
MSTILLVEDDVSFSEMLKRFLERHHHAVILSYTLEDAKLKVKESTFDLVFADLRLPDGDGISLLNHIKAKDASIPVVLMTGYAEVSTAVKAMKEGAFDYISKPFNPEEVLQVVKNALQKPSTEDKPTIQTPLVPSESSKLPTNLVKGISGASKVLYDHVNLVAPTDMSVLISGESGTGKEVVAKAIHLSSSRKQQPFIAVDCGAIPKEIAASEFFGHKKGSFTGAINDKKGHFEAANHGTLFLDEVGNLTYENQIQLLRALQERRIKPIGSNEEIEVDIRLLTATNEDLLNAVEQGDFREDLYHRLNEFSIKVPSLQERRDDLILYAEFFLDNANQQLNKSIIGFSPEVLKIFQTYSWPGNLRELSNVIKRATLLTNGELIQKEVLPQELSAPSKEAMTRSFSTKDNEKELIVKALQEVNNNKTKAAQLLNFSRKTLYNKLKEYNLD